MDTYTEAVTPKRRYRGLEEKRRIVEETLAEGASVALIARAHGVNANLVFNWRKLYQAGRLGSGRAKLLPASDSRTVDDGFVPNLPTSLAGQDSHSTATCASEHRRKCRSGDAAGAVGVSAAMIAPPGNTQIWIAAGVTDLRRGFTGLSAVVQTQLEQSPLSGQVFVFRGRRGDLIKVLWFDGDGLCLFSKRLERGRFVWPQASSGSVALTRAQLSMLLEGIDWRRPERTWDPQLAV
jgi:transposase